MGINSTKSTTTTTTTGATTGAAAVYFYMLRFYNNNGVYINSGSTPATTLAQVLFLSTNKQKQCLMHVSVNKQTTTMFNACMEQQQQ